MRTFALLLMAFAAALVALALLRPDALLVAGTVLAGAWLAAALLDRELPARTRRRGLFLPVLFLATGAGAAAAPAITAAGVAAIGILAAAACFPGGATARGVYDFWLEAARPVGWAVSRALLAVVWYGVVTPVGLLRRLFGSDPMARRLDRDAATYWVDRPAAPARDRYFRQF